LDVITKNADGYFDVLVDAYQIPAEETSYKYLCKTYDGSNEEFGNKKDLTMMGVTPIISAETREFVHHINVSLIPSCEKLGDASFNNGDMIYGDMIYGWATGQYGLVLPDDVGFPMFGSESNQAVLIQIHYNNPRRISGMMDSSGVRIYYTNTPRLHKAGVIRLVDPTFGLNGVKINDGYTQHEFTCPEQCSSLFLDDPVTVISELLHMHATGQRMDFHSCARIRVDFLALKNMFLLT
jgi:hypothetical protein